MKKLLSFLLAIAFVVSICTVPLAALAAGGVSAEISSVKGKVTVKRASSEKSINAFVGMKLKQGDVVTTAKGAETVVDISTDMSIKALTDSSFKITTLSASDTGFTLIKGTVFNQVRSKSAGNSVSVQTGNTVVGVRGTTYIVSLRGSEEDGSTIVRTLEGTVFLDNVRKRLEADDNASLVRDQAEVGTGEAIGADGVYKFGIDDLLPDELAYILEHPDEFDPDIVDEAQKALDSLPPDEDVDDGGDEIRYVPEQQPDTSDSSGPTTYYTVTFMDNASDGNLDYYSPGGTIRVAAGSTISPTQFPPAVKVGYSYRGWFDYYTEDFPTGMTVYEYSNGVTPVTGDVEIYPWFDQNTSEDGSSSATAYRITKENFPHFRYFVHYQYGGLNGSYELTDNIDCAAYTSSSIYRWAWDWEPIGSENYSILFTNAFSGSFDGGGFKISNFTCTKTSGNSNDRYAGFFGYLDGGSVQDLSLQGSINIDESQGSSTNFLFVGGIVGRLVNGTIAHCSANMSITATTGGDITMGGIVGEIWSSSYYDMVEECFSAGALVANSTSGGVFAGGIVGYCTANTAATVVHDCYSSADVSAETLVSTSDACAGGIVGRINGVSISTCYYRGGNVVANNTNATYIYATAGGIAGYIENNATIEHCVTYSGSVSVSASGNQGRIWGNSVGDTGIDNYSSKGITGFNAPVSSSIPESMDGADVEPTHLEVRGWWDGNGDVGPPPVTSPWYPGSSPWDFGSIWSWDVSYPILQ